MIHVNQAKTGGGIMGVIRGLVSIMAFVVLATTLGVCYVCAKATKDASDELNKATPEQAEAKAQQVERAATYGTDDALNQMAATADRVCQCTDQACLDASMSSMANIPTPAGRPSKAQIARAMKIADRMSYCQDLVAVRVNPRNRQGILAAQAMYVGILCDCTALECINNTLSQLAAVPKPDPAERATAAQQTRLKELRVRVKSCAKHLGIAVPKL